MTGLPQASRRQVPADILIYAAFVSSSKYSHKARQLWAYQTIMIGGAGLSTMQHLDSGYPPTNLRTLSRSISLSTGLHSWLMGEEAVLLDLHGIRPHSQRICVTPRQECSGGQRDGFKRQARKERRGKERQRLIKTALFCIEQREVCAPSLPFRAHLLMMFRSS